MSARDRTITTVLVSLAIGAWLFVAAVFTMVSPENDAGAQLLGALALGSAVALTLWPLFWYAARHAPDSLVSAGRRGALAGLVVSILVILRAIDVVSLPVLLFLVVGAVLVEVALTLRR